MKFNKLLKAKCLNNCQLVGLPQTFALRINCNRFGDAFVLFHLIQPDESFDLFGLFFSPSKSLKNNQPEVLSNQSDLLRVSCECNHSTIPTAGQPLNH